MGTCINPICWASDIVRWYDFAQLTTCCVRSHNQLKKRIRPDQFNFSKHGPDRPCFTGNENKIKKTAVFKKNSNTSKTLEVLALKFS